MSHELITIDIKTPMDLFSKDGGVDPILKSIEAEVKKHVPDITTAKGRADIVSLSAKIPKCKTYLDDLGAGLVEDMKKQVKVVDVSRKKIRDFLDNLKEETRKPVTDWENAEKSRVATHEKNIAEIVTLRSPVVQGMKLGLNTLKMNLEILETKTIDDSWEEYKDRAVRELKTSIDSLRLHIEEDEKREIEQAELKRLREEKEIRDKKDNEERIAKEAADRATENERIRVQREKDKEEKDRVARESDVAHKRSINKDVHTYLKEILSKSFVEPDMIEGVAKAIVIEIAKGNVPHVKINY